MYSTSELLSNPGVIAVIVILALGLFVFVPFMIRKGIRARARARNFTPNLIKMSGLIPNGDVLEGDYKGFPTVLKMGVSYNYAEAASNTLGALSGGSANYHSRSMISPKFTVEMDLPKPAVSAIIIKQKVGVLRSDQFINDMIAGKGIELPEVKNKDVRFRKARAFSHDADLAVRMANDAELQQLLHKWHYTDIRVNENKLVFTLDDVMVQATFGNRITTPDYIIQGLNIAARTAQLVTNT
ncbi:MAG: hypothetical protein KKA07_13300 [Bacteroidetes bacterium]|nr:hypothetical protein [Bacteroidota bacterium]MBU1720036.1 hypothetical protein [Bacteroidota bacterium]